MRCRISRREFASSLFQEKAKNISSNLQTMVAADVGRLLAGGCQENQTWYDMEYSIRHVFRFFSYRSVGEGDREG